MGSAETTTMVHRVREHADALLEEVREAERLQVTVDLLTADLYTAGNRTRRAERALRHAEALVALVVSKQESIDPAARRTLLLAASRLAADLGPVPEEEEPTTVPIRSAPPRRPQAADDDGGLGIPIPPRGPAPLPAGNRVR